MALGYTSEVSVRILRPVSPSALTLVYIMPISSSYDSLSTLETVLHFDIWYDHGGLAEIHPPLARALEAYFEENLGSRTF